MSYYKPYLLFNKPAAAAASLTIASKWSTTGASVALTGVPAGALLVVCVGCAFNTAQDCTITATGHTFTKRADAGGTNCNNAEIHTAVSAAGGSITISRSWTNNNEVFMYVFVVTGQEATLGGTSGTQAMTSTGLPSVTVTTTRANSILFCMTSDWQGQDGTSRVYRDSATEPSSPTGYNHPNGAVTFYVYYKQTTSIGSYTEGLTAPGTQQAATAVYEVRTP